MADSRFENDDLERLANSAPTDLHGQSTPAGFVACVLRTWRDTDPRTDQTVTRMGEIAVRFAKRLDATGIHDITQVDQKTCEAFIDAPSRTGDQPAETTRHFRRVTLRAVFRTGRQLSILDGDPTVDITLPPRSSATARPLHTDEVVLCRTSAFKPTATDLRRPAAWALAEATAITSEIPAVRRRDLQLTGGTPEAVQLPGTRRVRPRTVELTDWASRILEERLAEIPTDSDTPVAYQGNAPNGTVARQAAACGLVAAVLNTSGVGQQSDVRPASVRHWRARVAFERGATIESVAVMLGHRSLDETADAIGHRWWEHQ